MHRASRKDTIAAVATPPGEGGVGIVRLSGPQSAAIAAAMFTAAARGFAGLQPHHLHYGTLRDAEGRVLDDVLAAHMPGPRSYTGEDVVEFHCHGGRAVVAAVLAEVLDRGARQAERGEFTLRAFLNGRLDLTQAEAVAEMIHAPTKGALHLAQLKLSGVLGERIRALRARLEEQRAQLCLAVDFPEDDVECLPPDVLADVAERTAAEIGELLAGVERTRAWREGALAVLLGRVNAGKSSLLNALLGKSRAIVTDIPGTTRDYLEESLNLDGLTVRIADTAGLRETEDAVERAGLEISRELAGRADLVLLLVDGSGPLTDDVAATVAGLDPARTLAVVNKIDLLPEGSAASGVGAALRAAGLETVAVSAKRGDNLSLLAARMRERVLAGAGEPDPDELAPNARQARALAAAREELAALAADARASIPHDLLGVRLETACTVLGEITGEIAPADVLNAIFDTFCIGK